MDQYIETAENLLKILLPVVVTVLTPVVLVLAKKVTSKFSDKLDAETKSAVHDMVSTIVAQGVHYAEQYAKTQQKVVQGKLDGESKLEQATFYIVDHLDKYNLPQLAAHEIKNKVESYLGTATFAQNHLGERDDEEPVGFE